VSQFHVFFLYCLKKGTHKVGVHWCLIYGIYILHVNEQYSAKYVEVKQPFGRILTHRRSQAYYGKVQ